MLSAEVNIVGTVNLMFAAVENKIERIVLALAQALMETIQNYPK